MKSSTGIASRTAMAAVLASMCAFAPLAHADDDQAQQFTPEYLHPHTTYDAKHTPKIVAPDSVKRGEWFDVTISVGAGGTHPSLMEHSVRYIALYINDVEIARAYLHPVYSKPTVTFTIALDQGGELRAMEEPNHSAVWVTTRKIEVRP